MIWWEDFEVGERSEMGRHTFNEKEIVDFAKQFDPQPFHLDAAAAAKTPFGGLVASGWHTAAVMMKLRVAYMTRAIESARTRNTPVVRFGPSPGFDDLKWLKPVYAGDEIAFSGTIVAKRQSRSRPGWGIVSIETTGVNQKGEPVFAYTGHVFAAITDKG